MAPKRRSGRAVKKVVTTTKTVVETVKVVVGVTGGEKEQVDLLSTSSKENQSVEVLEPVSRTILVQERSTPPAPHQEEVYGEDDETQPASQPDTPPATTPPPKVGPYRKPIEVGEKKRKKREVADGGKKRRRRPSWWEGYHYERYLWKVMKQVNPEMGISSKAMTVLNNLMGDMFERLADEAARLQVHARRKTMSSKEIQAAVKLMLPGELGKHAIAEGTKAVSNYISYVP